MRREEEDERYGGVKREEEDERYGGVYPSPPQ